MTIDALRTPEERFDNLPGYSFQPNYIDTLQGYEGLRVHYIDEGPKDAEHSFLCLHGQPTWSFLYRKMIPIFLESDARVVAPAWLGFGKSDKPINDDIYTFGFHRNMLLAFVEALDLKNITLVCQDWGGILGLCSGPDLAERLSRLIVMNTTIPVGESPGPGFDAWKAFNRSQPDMDIVALMQRGTDVLSAAEAAAYGAPFPDRTYKAGVRRFPELVMVDPEMDGVETAKHAAEWWSNDWNGETFMAIGMADPVLGAPMMTKLVQTIKGCPEPLRIEEAGHFVQEWGEQVARAALSHFGGA